MYNKILNRMKPSASMSKGLIESNSNYNLAVGSPDIAPPEQIRTLIKEFANNPNFQYQPTKGGSLAIRNVVKLIDNSNEQINPDKNVILIPGAKYGVYLTLKTICNLGDSVILIEPYWLSYTDICESLSLNVSFWEPTANEYNLNDLILLVENSLIKPKAIIINNPINPSGYIFDSNRLNQMIDYCKENEIWIILDEVYKDLCFDIELNLHENLFLPNLIRIGSFSKSLAIPGFRSGYIFACEEFISNFNLLHQHIATSINSLTSFLLAHIDKEIYKSYTNTCSLIYKERYEIAYLELLKKNYLPLKSQSTFYMLFDVNNKYNNGKDACENFEKSGIILTPGFNYGRKYDNSVRICLVKDVKIISEIIQKL